MNLSITSVSGEMLLADFFYARTEQFSKSGESKIKTLDYMIAISFMITHGSIDSAGL